MTDNDIIKALECCSCESIMYCEDSCPFYEKCINDEHLSKYALDLINRQKAEIERLQKEQDLFADIGKMYSEIKAEAVKEFANNLQEELIYHIWRVVWLIEFGEDKEQTKYYQGVEKTLKNMNTLIDENLKETVGDGDGCKKM